MPTFLIMRHGETDFNSKQTIQGWRASSLTENGRAQILAATKALPQTPDVIVSSDLLRCRQTTEIVSEQLPDVPVLYDWRLRERAFGTLEGQPRSVVDWNIFFTHDTPHDEHNVEPESHLSERVKAALFGTKYLGVETILIVTHGGVLNRIGGMFVDNFSFRQHHNGEVVTYNLAYSDERFVPGDYTSWSMNHDPKA